MLEAIDSNDFTHWFRHRLAVAVRFTDVFTERPVETPLRVTISGASCSAIYRAADSTYRFMLTEAPVPSGVFQLAVEDPEQTYVNHQPIELTLAPGPSTPPISRQDYLYQFPLWPTRKFKVPIGETAVVGRLVSTSSGSVGNLDVHIFTAGETPPPTPFARSNPEGEFLFRLPWVTRETDGTARPTSLDVQVSLAGVPIGSVTPSNFTLNPGRVQCRTFDIP